MRRARGKRSDDAGPLALTRLAPRAVTPLLSPNPSLAPVGRSAPYARRTGFFGGRLNK